MPDRRLVSETAERAEDAREAAAAGRLVEADAEEPRALRPRWHPEGSLCGAAGVAAVARGTRAAVAHLALAAEQAVAPNSP